MWGFPSQAAGPVGLAGGVIGRGGYRSRAPRRQPGAWGVRVGPGALGGGAALSQVRQFSLPYAVVCYRAQIGGAGRSSLLAHSGQCVQLPRSPARRFAGADLGVEQQWHLLVYFRCP